MFRQNTPLEKLDRKHFAKGSRKPEQNGVVVAPQVGNVKEIALLEAKIRRLCDLLDEVGDANFLSSPKGKDLRQNMLTFKLMRSKFRKWILYVPHTNNFWSSSLGKITSMGLYLHYVKP